MNNIEAYFVIAETEIRFDFEICRPEHLEFNVRENGIHARTFQFHSGEYSETRVEIVSF